MNSETTKRPWGSFTRFTENESSTVKILNISKGEKLSLQYHARRDEFWRIISGNPEIIIGEDKFDAKEGEEFNVPAEIKHRISAPYNDVTILEIATGDFDEEDIVRVEDEYGRV